MKSIIYFFSFVLLSAMTINMNVAPTDPIPGVDVKLGRKPPGGIIATVVTDSSGTVVFENLAAGKGYFLEYGIKENGIKSSENPIIMEGIEVVSASTSAINTATNRQPTAIVKQIGAIEITLTVRGIRFGVRSIKQEAILKDLSVNLGAI